MVDLPDNIPEFEAVTPEERVLLDAVKKGFKDLFPDLKEIVFLSEDESGDDATKVTLKEAVPDKEKKHGNS